MVRYEIFFFSFVVCSFVRRRGSDSFCGRFLPLFVSRSSFVLNRQSFRLIFFIPLLEISVLIGLVFDRVKTDGSLTTKVVCE